MRLVLSVALLALVAGCANKKAEPAPAANTASADRVAELRAAYTQKYAGVKIGVVDNVLKDGPYLSAGDLDTAGLKVNDVVSVIDGEENLIANGYLRVVNEGNIAVQFEEPTDGKRRPMVGDLVVKF